MISNAHPDHPSGPQRRAGERQARALLKILHDVDQAVRESHPADAALGRLFRQNRFGSRDRRFFTNTVFSFYRWKGWIDGPSDPPHAASCVYASLLDEETLYPAITVLAEMAGLSPEHLIPLGHKSIVDKAAALPDIMKQDRSFPIDNLVPEWVRSHIEHAKDNSFYNRLVESFQSRPPTWLRTRAGEREAVIRALEANGHTAHPHPVFPEALAVDAAISRHVVQSSGTPYFEIQDLASQCVGAVCDPQPGGEWWDVCAGAGGKSLHWAARMREQGVILATDIRSGALRELERRAMRMNTRMITPLRVREDKPFPIDSRFDGVLIDAPCTGLGTWSRNPDARWRMSREEISQKARRQSDLLHRAAPHVKSGGALVYAACTLTHEETTGIVADFLNHHSDFEPAPFPHPLTGKETDGHLFLWPWEGPCDGMFIARFRKNGSDGPPLRGGVLGP